MKTAIWVQNGELLAGLALDRRMRKKRYVVTRPAGHAKNKRYVVRAWEALRKRKVWRQILQLRVRILTPYLLYLAENNRPLIFRRRPGALTDST